MDKEKKKEKKGRTKDMEGTPKRKRIQNPRRAITQVDSVSK